MKSTAWQSANQRHLSAEIASVVQRVRRDPDDAVAEAAAPEAAMPDAPMPDAAIARLQALFALTSFERALVAWCVGYELDAEVAQLGAPTFGLALASLPDAHWSALTPERPLRRYRLLEVQGGGSLVSAPLRIDERVLHYLLGSPGIDARLDGVVSDVVAADALVASHAALADAIVGAWRAATPVIELWGADAEAQRAVAATACARLGRPLYRLHIDAIGRELDERQVARLLAREALLDGAVILLDEPDGEPATAAMARRLTERLDAPVIVTGRHRGRRGGRPAIAFEVAPPTVAEQRGVFAAALANGPHAEAASRGIERVISQFTLGAPAIRTLCADIRQSADIGDALWDGCRAQARPQLDDLAQRIDARVGWRDLVISDAQRRTLQELAARVRQRTQVYDTWGFGARGGRGLGISALFAGPSGTGKTLAAEVLAAELRLDLYRVDLSQVVSKYIGETERNLARVFDAAEQGAAVLLFDEADALFGKRGEVKDSHDRYANMEVSYLLQRMEAYRGLAILTTNFRAALDPAFTRRLAFIIDFAMPDLALRAEIWRGVFPARTPTEGLDVDQLARLSLSGGNIRSVALAAAFLAADAGEPVRMAHIAAAARVEFAKLERSVPSELARMAGGAS